VGGSRRAAGCSRGFPTSLRRTGRVGCRAGSDDEAGELDDTDTRATRVRAGRRMNRRVPPTNADVDEKSSAGHRNVSRTGNNLIWAVGRVYAELVRVLYYALGFPSAARTRCNDTARNTMTCANRSNIQRTRLYVVRIMYVCMYVLLYIVMSSRYFFTTPRQNHITYTAYNILARYNTT